MTIRETLEAQLQQLGSRKVTSREFPQSSRWGAKYIAYTSLTGRLDTFIFLGAAGAIRTGASPALCVPNENLKEKLLRRAAAQIPKGPRPKAVLSLDDIKL